MFASIRHSILHSADLACETSGKMIRYVMGSASANAALEVGDRLVAELKEEALPILEAGRLKRVAFTPEEIAYFAGILDGEGTFTIYHVGKVYSALISVASTSEELIEWLASRFAGGSYRPVAIGNREQAVQWQLRFKPHLLVILPQVIPYLVIKKLQARLLLKYCLEFKDSRRGVPISEEIAATRDAYCSLFTALNSKGVGSNIKKASVLKLFESGGVSLP